MSQLYQLYSPNYALIITIPIDAQHVFLILSKTSPETAPLCTLRFVGNLNTSLVIDVFELA